MKTGFKETNSIKKQAPEDKPKDMKPYPLGWDHRCPQYDQRSSCFVNAGTSYGQGHRQPVGHKGNPDQRAETLPYGRPDTMKTRIDYDEVY